MTGRKKSSGVPAQRRLNHAKANESEPSERLYDPIEIHETECADCDARVLPCLNERGTAVRCSSCRAARVARLIADRRGICPVAI